MIVLRQASIDEASIAHACDASDTLLFGEVHNTIKRSRGVDP